MENITSDPLLTPSTVPLQQTKISTFGKVWRIGLLWITCPIWSILRSTFKTLKKICGWIFYRPYLVWSKYKYEYAKAISENKLKGYWYDKKWFIILRRVFSQIDWSLHLAIGIIVAPFKFIKSFFMGFLASARVTKDIYINEPNAYVYSHLNSHENLTIFTENKYKNVDMISTDTWNNDFDNKYSYLKPSLVNRIIRFFEIKILNIIEFFVSSHSYKLPITKYKPESTIPYVNTHYVPEKDKSFWIHVKAILGVNKIIPIENKGYYQQETRYVNYR